MGFKSKNWETLAETDLCSTVEYMESLLERKTTKSPNGFVMVSVPTVIVSVMDATTGKIFVGVSRCAPMDNYSPKLGREIACGRAMKLWTLYNRRTPKDVPQQKFTDDDSGAKFKVISSNEEDLALFLKP